MNKHNTLPRSLLIPSLIIYVVLIGVLILTAVMPDIDLEISSRIADVNSAFGNFLEIWAEPPTLLLASFCFAMAAALNARKKTAAGNAAALLCDVCGAVAAFQTVSRTVKYYNPEFFAKWYVMLACGLLGVLILVACRLAVSRIKTETLEKTGKTLFFVAVTLIMTLAIISGLKYIWGRTRYRQYVTEPSGTPGGFTPWYLPQGAPTSDGYKSFPSGHTSNALLLLPMTYILDAAEKKLAARICRGVVCVWVPVVMFSRVLCGAHYLSDVCAGAFVTYTIILVTVILIYRDKKPKKVLKN